jgi:cobyrinic acid a,c-diamide synthase
MDNLFESNITKVLSEKISTDFISGLYKAHVSGTAKLEIDRIMALDETLSLDKNKKAEHLKNIFSEMG